MRSQHQPLEQSSSSGMSLTLPQSPYLVKQHSHPVLPSQMASSAPIVVHRQLSQPGQRSRVSLHQQHRLPMQTSLDSALVVDYYPSNSGNNNDGPPPSIRVVAAGSTEASSPEPSTDDHPMRESQNDKTTTTLLSLPSAEKVHASTSEGDAGNSGLPSASSNPLLIISGTGSLDYAPALRVKDELQRSISTPQVS